MRLSENREIIKGQYHIKANVVLAFNVSFILDYNIHFFKNSSESCFLDVVFFFLLKLFFKS